MLENAVVLAREADKQLGLVEEDSKVSKSQLAQAQGAASGTQHCCVCLLHIRMRSRVHFTSGLSRADGTEYTTLRQSALQHATLPEQ